MTKLLMKAIREVTKLPAEDQDAMAWVMLEELASEKRWARSFARSKDGLARLADEARAEYRNGRTTPLEEVL